MDKMTLQVSGYYPVGRGDSISGQLNKGALNLIGHHLQLLLL